MTTTAGREITAKPRPSRRARLARALGLVAAVGLVAAAGGHAEPEFAAERPATTTTAFHALHFEPNPIVLRAISSSLSAAEAPTSADPRTLDEVFWTVPDDATPELLAATWGVGRRLYELNPDLSAGAKISAGTTLRVYEADPDEPTRSIGAPNRGRLVNGIPLPEGNAWRLRPHRRRAFGTHKTVSTLVQVFEAYGVEYPDAPKVRVGELASRKGGRASPHRSHRSGRDVDLGYIGLGEDDGDIRWQRMHAGNFDAEKNWFLIHEMIKSGNVETIFVSKKLQTLLYKEAKRQGMSDEELAGIFQYPRGADSAKAIIKHWKGHADHMHVRFRCEAWNQRCRG